MSDARPWVKSYDEGVDPDLPIPPISFVEMLETGFTKYADRFALHFMGTSLTFAELDDASKRMARYLCDIGCKPGDVAPYVLLCGDPARAHLVADRFDDARGPITHREYVTITGAYKGIPITIMATGMGSDNTEMAYVELSQIVENPTCIRIGSSGALRKEMELGDLVISSGAVRLENTSTSYVPEGFPAVAHYECVLALLEASRLAVLAQPSPEPGSAAVGTLRTTASLVADAQGSPPATVAESLRAESREAER